VLLFALSAACGGDDEGSTGPTSTSTESDIAGDTPTGEPTDEANDTDSQPEASSGEAGVVEIDSEAYPIGEVLRCEPFFEHEDDLDLTALGSGAQVFVVINHPLDNLEQHELSVQGSVGVYSGSASSTAGGGWADEDGEPLPGPPFEISGDRITGSLVVVAARGGDEAERITVSFDLEIPSEVEDCSL
jgi:hypothetical protein